MHVNKNAALDVGQMTACSYKFVCIEKKQIFFRAQRLTKIDVACIYYIGRRGSTSWWLHEMTMELMDGEYWKKRPSSAVDIAGLG